MPPVAGKRSPAGRAPFWSISASTLLHGVDQPRSNKYCRVGHHKQREWQEILIHDALLTWRKSSALFGRVRGADLGGSARRGRELPEVFGEKIVDRNSVLRPVTFQFLADALNRSVEIGIGL
jgi:hypothetical protein